MIKGKHSSGCEENQRRDDVVRLAVQSWSHCPRLGEARAALEGSLPGAAGIRGCEHPPVCAGRQDRSRHNYLCTYRN
jgi:hypothetical protein